MRYNHMDTSLPTSLHYTRLACLRKHIVGLTQSRLARYVGMSRSYIFKLENGERRLTMPLAQRISAITGVSPLWLTGRVGEMSQPLDVLLQPYDPDSYMRQHTRLNRGDSINPDDDTAVLMHTICYRVTSILQTAHFKGRLYEATALLREMERELIRRLGYVDDPELSG